MIRFQRGASSITILCLVIFAGMLIILAIKSIPAYSEYFTIKRKLNELVNQGLTGSEAKEKFDKQKYISDILSIGSKDLKIKQNAGLVAGISVEYRREVPLFGNTGLYFDFNIDAVKSARN